MSSFHFKSGPWVGFYNYRGQGQQHLMDLHLHFRDGRIGGEGADGINTFVITGFYDTQSLECGWKKIYPTHTVHYQGHREGKGIWGVWEISGSKGGFQIWPLSDGAPPDLRKLEEETPLEIAMPAPLIQR